MEDYTTNKKLRKSLIVSQALHDSERLTGKIRMKDAESITLSLRLGGYTNVPDYEDLEWNIDDCRKIIEDSMVTCSEKELLARTILNALTSSEKIALPDSVQVRICSNCKKEKVVGEGFTECDWLCRDCRRAANKAKNMEQTGYLKIKNISRSS